MMFLVKHRKLNTPIHQLLEMGLHPPLILAGLVQPLVALISHPQEALPNQQHLASLRLGPLPQVPFHLAQEPRASFPEPLLPQVDTLQDRAYLDSSPPTLELQDSSLQCQVSSHQVGHPCHTPFLDSSPPHLGLHRAHIQACLTRQVHLDLACTAQEDLVPFHQMEAPDMEEECFPQYHQDPGVHPEGASLLNLAHREASVQGPWDHTEGLQLQVECCHHIDHHIFEHNEQLCQSQEEDSTTAITKTPPLPYDLPLHAGIMPCLVITIVGEPVPGGNRFHVDFVRGHDVVFHFSPHFHENTIVRNTQLGGCWGPEERHGGFPFVQGRQFELKILVEADGFKVAVDGVHLLEFEHRTGGMEDVTHLHIEGDLVLFSAAPSMI
uniref:Galectin n=1 Tax=Cyprinus carpio TaxID=7962 RepID=A0A8C1PT67_CYPCA